MTAAFKLNHDFILQKSERDDASLKTYPLGSASHLGSTHCWTLFTICQQVSAGHVSWLSRAQALSGIPLRGVSIMTAGVKETELLHNYISLLLPLFPHMRLLMIFWAGVLHAARFVLLYKSKDNLPFEVLRCALSQPTTQLCARLNKLV